MRKWLILPVVLILLVSSAHWNPTSFVASSAAALEPPDDEDRDDEQQRPDPIDQMTLRAARMAGGVAEREVEKEAANVAKQRLRNAAFKNWFHKVYKQQQGFGGPGRDNPNMSTQEVNEAWDEWVQDGRPKPK